MKIKSTNKFNFIYKPNRVDLSSSFININKNASKIIKRNYVIKRMKYLSIYYKNQLKTNFAKNNMESVLATEKNIIELNEENVDSIYEKLVFFSFFLFFSFFFYL